MRIGYDAKKIGANLTGIGNYSRGILNGLTRFFPQHAYYLYFPAAPRPEAMERLAPSGSLHTCGPTGLWRRSLLREVWRSWGVVGRLRKDGVGIYHGLSNELPVGLKWGSIRTVVTIHDLIFLRYPDTYTYMARRLLEWKTRSACRRADRIVAISEQTKADIVHYYGVPAGKIRVVYQGCDAVFRSRVPEERRWEVMRKYGLADGFLLSVGTFEPRKNHRTLLKAMIQVPDRQLVLVGKRTPYQQELERLAARRGIADRVVFLNGVSNAELAALYQSCSVSVYLSWFEGFGIPVLEAMASRAPVVAASGSCLEEVGGDTCLYCPPFDADALVDCLQSVWEHPRETVERVERAAARSERFSAERIACDLMAVYRELAEVFDS